MIYRHLGCSFRKKEKERKRTSKGGRRSHFYDVTFNLLSPSLGVRGLIGCRAKPRRSTLVISAWDKDIFPHRACDHRGLWATREWTRTRRTIKSSPLRVVTDNYDTLLFFKKGTHYHMIQQFHFLVYDPKYGKQGLGNICIPMVIAALFTTGKREKQ